MRKPTVFLSALVFSAWAANGAWAGGAWSSLFGQNSAPQSPPPAQQTAPPASGNPTPDFNFAEADQAFPGAQAPTAEILDGIWKRVGKAYQGGRAKYDLTGLKNPDGSVAKIAFANKHKDFLGATKIVMREFDWHCQGQNQGPYEVDPATLRHSAYATARHSCPRVDKSIPYSVECRLLSEAKLLCRSVRQSDGYAEYMAFVKDDSSLSCSRCGAPIPNNGEEAPQCAYCGSVGTAVQHQP